MRTIAGKVQSYHPVDPFDRGTAQIDLFVRHSQTLEFCQYQSQAMLFDLRLSPFEGVRRKTVQKIGVEELILYLDLVIKGMVIKPAGQL